MSSSNITMLQLVAKGLGHLRDEVVLSEDASQSCTQKNRSYRI